MQSLLSYVANNSNQQIKPSQLSRLIVTNQNHPSELFNSDSSSEIEQQFTSVESKQIPILYVHLTIIDDTYIIPIYTDFDISYLSQYIKGKEQHLDIIYSKVCDRIEEYINQLNILNYKQEQPQNKRRVYIIDKQVKNGQIIYQLDIDGAIHKITFIKFPIESYINVRKLECFGKKLDLKLNLCDEFNKTVQKFIQNNSLSLEIRKELVDVLKNDL